MTILKYSPNGLVAINSNYEVNYAIFAKHCDELKINNPIILGEYFEYIDDQYNLIDRTGNTLSTTLSDSETLDLIISHQDDFIELLNFTPTPIPLVDQIVNLRNELEKTPVIIDEMEFIGDSSTRSSLNETIQFLRQLGEKAPETISWNAENGFFDLTLEKLTAIGVTLGVKRQRAFAAQGVVENDVTNGTISTIVDAKIKFNLLVNTL